MSSHTTEKKQYPSQLNSKTISARIPVQDYVEFLQESMSKGISLNDWLLMKIYNSKIGNNDNGAIELKTKDCEEMGYSFEHVLAFYKDEFINGTFTINKERLIEILGALYNNTTQLQHFLDKLGNKQPSLTDIKVQIRSLVRSKIHRNDQDEYLKEINRILKELE